MIRRTFAAAALLVLTLAACGEEQQAAAPPPPAELTRDAVGHYDQMIVVDHRGPKGQIFVEGRDQPYWFSSVRDAVAFTMLPEEPKDIRAIYVQDIGRAESWDDPGPKSWTEARKALFVLGSDRLGGMGQPEAVPFTDRAAAEAFVREHGGRIVAFAEIPRDEILSSAPPAMAGHPPGAGAGHSAHPKEH